MVLINLAEDVIDCFIQGYFSKQRGNIDFTLQPKPISLRTMTRLLSLMMLPLCSLKYPWMKPSITSKRLLERVTKGKVFSFNGT